MKYVAQSQMKYKKGTTIAKLALNIGNVMTPHSIPKDQFFDDDLYFYKEEEEEEDEGRSKQNFSQNNGYYNSGFRV